MSLLMYVISLFPSFVVWTSRLEVKLEQLCNIKCPIKNYLAGETCSGPNPCFAGLQVHATLLPTSNVFWALVWQCLLEAQRA
jgi:hypothetical protein